MFFQGKEDWTIGKDFADARQDFVQIYLQKT